MYFVPMGGVVREDIVGVREEGHESRSISSFKRSSLLQGTHEIDYSLTNGNIICETASMKVSGVTPLVTRG